jgi:hypothetical protein
MVLVLRYGQDTGLFAAYMKNLQAALFALRDTLSPAILGIVTQIRVIA